MPVPTLLTIRLESGVSKLASQRVVVTPLASILPSVSVTAFCTTFLTTVLALYRPIRLFRCMRGLASNRLGSSRATLAYQATL